MRVHIHSNILTALLLIAVTSQTTHSRPAVPTADVAHSRHRRNAADLGDLTAAQTGILNVDHAPARDCTALKDDGFTASGLYKVYPGDGEGEFTVFCDMTLLGGGWTVIQRRVDDTQSFEREWKEYRNGFGDFNKNFWLGLHKIKRVTDMSDCELYVGLEDHFTPSYTAWARYGTFGLGSEASNYPINIGLFDNLSPAGDSLATHNGEKFSTIDKDNDPSGATHCAQEYKAGWWYRNCHDSNLNGVWYAGGTLANVNIPDGIIWQHWSGDEYSLKTSVMALKCQ